MTLVAISTYCYGNLVCRGTGIKVCDYIIAHVSAIGIKPHDSKAGFHDHAVSNYQSIDLDRYEVYFYEKCTLPFGEHPVKIRQRTKFLKTWQCRTVQHFFRLLFPEIPVDENCAKFVLLGTVSVSMPSDEKEMLEILQSMSCSTNLCESLEEPRIMKRVIQFNSKNHTFSSSGLISYTFKNSTIFLVDQIIPCGSIVLSKFNNWKDAKIVGIALYGEKGPNIFQDFPICISIKHILSEMCLRSRCGIEFHPLFNLKDLERNNLFLEISVRIRCGTNQGSGTLISKDKVLTCAHLIKDHMHHNIIVFFNNQPYNAQVIFYPDDIIDHDFAILLVAAPPTPIIAISHRPVILGESVFAIGTPYISNTVSLYPFISSGIIIQRNKKMMFGSCKVHAGFSGGGLFNIRGYLIGIVCGKAISLDAGPQPSITHVTPILFIVEILQSYVSSPSSKRNKSFTHLVDLINELKFPKAISSNL